MYMEQGRAFDATPRVYAEPSKQCNEIVRELRELTVEVEQLQVSVGELIGRLSPVVVPAAQPSGPTLRSRSPCGSSLGGELQMLADRISTTRCQIDLAVSTLAI